MRVEPITCLRPVPERAGSFAAPPYDVFDDDQARSYVAAHPASFLDIDRPETAFPRDVDPYAPQVYAHAAALVRARRDDGTLVDDPTPSLYAYRLAQGGHAQTGIVAAASVDDYQDGTIRRHEQVRDEKVRDRMRHIEALGCQTGPALLTYADHAGIDAKVAASCAQEPLYDFCDDAGVRHTVWRIDDAEGVVRDFAEVGRAYIADGHHRAAASVRLCEGARAQGAASGARTMAEGFLAILYPASQMQVFAYNRVVSGTNGLSEGELVARLEREGVEVGPRASSAVVPERRGDVGMYAFGAWRRLTLCAPCSTTDPALALDVSILQRDVLAPLLGIVDPTSDPRISFVSGVEGSGALERLAGDDGVAFSMFATSIDDLMAVSDAGLLMPPKSTWFAPKPASGLFLREL